MSDFDKNTIDSVRGILSGAPPEHRAPGSLNEKLLKDVRGILRPDLAEADDKAKSMVALQKSELWPYVQKLLVNESFKEARLKYDNNQDLPALVAVATKIVGDAKIAAEAVNAALGSGMRAPTGPVGTVGIDQSGQRIESLYEADDDDDDDDEKKPKKDKPKKDDDDDDEKKPKKDDDDDKDEKKPKKDDEDEDEDPFGLDDFDLGDPDDLPDLDGMDDDDLFGDEPGGGPGDMDDEEPILGIEPPGEFGGPEDLGSGIPVVIHGVMVMVDEPGMSPAKGKIESISGSGAVVRFANGRSRRVQFEHLSPTGLKNHLADRVLNDPRQAASVVDRLVDEALGLRASCSSQARSKRSKKNKRR